MSNKFAKFIAVGEEFHSLGQLNFVSPVFSVKMNHSQLLFFTMFFVYLLPAKKSKHRGLKGGDWIWTKRRPILAPSYWLVFFFGNAEATWQHNNRAIVRAQ